MVATKRFARIGSTGFFCGIVALLGHAGVCVEVTFKKSRSDGIYGALLRWW